MFVAFYCIIYYHCYVIHTVDTTTKLLIYVTIAVCMIFAVHLSDIDTCRFDFYKMQIK